MDFPTGNRINKTKGIYRNVSKIIFPLQQPLSFTDC